MTLSRGQGIESKKKNSFSVPCTISDLTNFGQILDYIKKSKTVFKMILINTVNDKNKSTIK